MGAFLDHLARGVEHLVGRFDGPLHFRLFVMPTVVTVLAILADRRDAREGLPAHLGAFFTNPAERRRLFRRGGLVLLREDPLRDDEHDEQRQDEPRRGNASKCHPAHPLGRLHASARCDLASMPPEMFRALKPFCSRMRVA